MPTSRQTDGKLPGRAALLSMMNNPDMTQFLTTLLSSVVLKEDLKIPSDNVDGPAPGTTSLPSARDTVLTQDGGYAIRIKADVDMDQGTVVTSGVQGYSSCKPHVMTDKDAPIGVIYEDVPAGEMATVVVAGLARVKVQRVS